MTIQELYNWAKEKGCLDKSLAKSCNMEVFDIESAFDTSDYPDYIFRGTDKVILD